MEYSWLMGFLWIHLDIYKLVYDFQYNRMHRDRKDLNCDMDWHIVHFCMFDRMDSLHQYNIRLAIKQLDVLELW